MKRLLSLCLTLGIAMLAALPLTPVPETKATSLEYHNAGSLKLAVSNMGVNRDLTYPPQTGDKLLYQGGIWISGKLQRRDEEGRKIFWLAQNPSAESSGTTFEGAPDWNPSLKAVIDTLTSVCCDGDLDIYELLPAYNFYAGTQPQYVDYNEQDRVLKSILGFPAPREFAWPDPLGTYCFTAPQPTEFASPGFETFTAYFYDFCPLGVVGDRDLGTHREMSIHYPLGLAIQQESYSWNLQNHDRMIVFKITLHNTSLQDTIFDLALGEFVDADIYPAGQADLGVVEDISGYVSGYEFAYSRDASGDGGLSPNWVGHKLILPGFAGNRACWSWNTWYGPIDFHPRNFDYPPRCTANEKYWLMTGRNPRGGEYSPYSSLRSEEEGVHVVEEPTWGDTRFLNALYGNQPGEDDPNPDERLNLAPGASLSYYSVYFAGNGLAEMQNLSQNIDAFIAGGLEIGPSTGLTCIPYLMDLQVVDGQVARLDWHSYTDPHHFELKYKPFDAPASEWAVRKLPGPCRSVWLWELDPGIWYQIKIAAVYEPGEVYLESKTLLTSLGQASEPRYEVPPVSLSLENFPNPFAEKTMIRFSVAAAGPAKLLIVNSKGQLVRELFDSSASPGTFLQLWDGHDANAAVCASGIYFLRLDSGGGSLVRKIALIRD